MKALIIDGVAVNVVAADRLADSFHPAVAVQFVDVPDEVSEGWRLIEGDWTAPEEIEQVAPVYHPEAYVVDVPTFKMRFSPQQLVAVRASEDAIVKVFLSEILDDPRTVNVNLALPFVQQAIGYLAQEGLIDQADVDAILAPTA